MSLVTLLVLSACLGAPLGAQAQTGQQGAHPGAIVVSYGYQVTWPTWFMAAPGQVLALTVHETKSYMRQLLQAGASGYIVKRSAAEELIQALHAVAAEGVYLDPVVTAKLVGTPKASHEARADGGTLSDREAKVLRLIALGYANKEIATELDLSVKTVETFKTRSMEKLGLRSRVDIVRHALNRGWLRPTA